MEVSIWTTQSISFYLFSNNSYLKHSSFLYSTKPDFFSLCVGKILEGIWSFNLIVPIILSPYSMHLLVKEGELWAKPTHSELFKLLGKLTIKTTQIIS